MAEHPGGWALRCWYWRKPLPEQWAQTPDAFRDRVLKFWVEASESDPWTFDGLRKLLRDMIDRDDEIPPALTRWGLEVAAKRRRKRPGRKRDPQGDLRVLMAVVFAKEFLGWSERRACREIAKMPWPQRSPDGTLNGSKIHRSWQAVQSAANRAKGLPVTGK